MKAIKLRAVYEHRTMIDLITELLQQGMAAHPAEQRTIRHRVKLPLIYGAHAPVSDEDLSPDRLADILLAQETEDHLDRLR